MVGSYVLQVQSSSHKVGQTCFLGRCSRTCSFLRRTPRHSSIYLECSYSEVPQPLEGPLLKERGNKFALLFLVHFNVFNLEKLFLIACTSNIFWQRKQFASIFLSTKFLYVKLFINYIPVFFYFLVCTQFLPWLKVQFIWPRQYSYIPI